MPDRRAGLTHALAETLSALLVATTLADLSDEERADIQALPPPELSTRVDDEASWLVIEWGGSSQGHAWDGSEDDAREIVRSAGPLFAENLSGDYWISGGWRGHRGQDGSFQSG
jgi:hypothetical protein